MRDAPWPHHSFRCEVEPREKGAQGTAAFLISQEQTLSLITVSGESKLVIHSGRLYRHSQQNTQSSGCTLDSDVNNKHAYKDVRTNLSEALHTNC